MATVPSGTGRRRASARSTCPPEVFEYPYRRHLVWQVGEGLPGGAARGHAQDEDPQRGLRLAARSPSSRRGPAARAREAAVRRSTATAARRTARCRARYAKGVSVGEKKNALQARPLAEAARGAARRRSRRMDLESARTRGPEGRRSAARRRGQGALRGLAGQRELGAARRATSGTGSSSTRSRSTSTT